MCGVALKMPLFLYNHPAPFQILAVAPDMYATWTSPFFLSVHII